MSRVNKVRRMMGWLLHEWFERGLEFALAGASIVNARATLFQTSDGHPLAPFLLSALEFLSRAPVMWTVFLAIVGASHMAIVLASFGRDWFPIRALACMIQTAVYVAVSAAIITGPAPHQAGERYYFTSWLAFLAAVALLSQALHSGRQHRGDVLG